MYAKYINERIIAKSIARPQAADLIQNFIKLYLRIPIIFREKSCPTTLYILALRGVNVNTVKKVDDLLRKAKKGVDIRQRLWYHNKAARNTAKKYGKRTLKIKQR
jgi:hypothetical protein